MEPVRVKLYGLVWRTRRGYLTSSVVEALCVVAFVSVWFLGWPLYKQGLKPFDQQPPFGRFYLTVMDRAPWILLAAVGYKTIEVIVVLRRFAVRDVEQRRRGAAAGTDSAGTD